MPHVVSVRASTAASVRNASAPCHQPIRAPATIQAFWKSQCCTFAVDFFGCAVSQAPSFAARAGSGISSSGSLRAPTTTKSGGRAAGVAVGVAAAAAVVCLTGAGAVCFFVVFGAATGATATSARRSGVPVYGEASSGAPVCAYLPLRASVSLISGEPVLISFVPAGGDCETTVFAA
jgi:hypothetical protein